MQRFEKSFGQKDWYVQKKMQESDKANCHWSVLSCGPNWELKLDPYGSFHITFAATDATMHKLSFTSSLNPPWSSPNPLECHFHILQLPFWLPLSPSHRRSARLPLTADISCQYLASCQARGLCEPTVWLHESNVGADESQQYTFNLSCSSMSGVFKKKNQSLSFVCIIDDCTILPDRSIRCNRARLPAAAVAGRFLMINLTG